MASSTRLRVTACLITVMSLSLVAAPFLLWGQMPRDSVEPQKITIGAAGLLGLIMFAGFAVSIGSVVTGFMAVRRRDWLAFAMSVPAPVIAIGFVFYFWVIEGM